MSRLEKLKALLAHENGGADNNSSQYNATAAAAASAEEVVGGGVREVGLWSAGGESKPGGELENSEKLKLCCNLGR